MIVPPGTRRPLVTPSPSSDAHLSFIKQCDDPAVDRHDTVKVPQAPLPGRTILLHLVDHKMQPPLIAESAKKMKKYFWIASNS